MDPTGDRVEDHGKTSSESSRPIRLGGSVLGPPRHICAFFNNRDDEYRVLLPFIKDGLECGEKAVHTVDPQRRDEHLRRLTSAGIDVIAAGRSGQFELHTWTGTHLRNGRFDPDKTLALFEEVVKNAKQQGFPLVRFVDEKGVLSDKPKAPIAPSETLTAPGFPSHTLFS
jgi:hypothetical protein